MKIPCKYSQYNNYYANKLMYSSFHLYISFYVFIVLSSFFCCDKGFWPGAAYDLLWIAGCCRLLREVKAGTASRNHRDILHDGLFADPWIPGFLIQTRHACPGNGTPNWGICLYQLKIKPIPHIYVQRPIWFRQSLNWDCLLRQC